MTVPGNLVQDVRFAMRHLRRSGFFSLTVIVTLALSVGATAAMVGVLRATLLAPLPYPEAGQLVNVADHNLKGFASSGLVSVLRTVDLAELKHDGHKVFSDLGYLYSDDSTVSLGNENPIGVTAFGVSDDFFKTVATAPMMGRTVIASDGVRNAPEVVVLSYRLWKSAFAGDAQVVGRTIKLGTVRATVVGVMPERFNLPAGTELWHHGHISAANFGGYRGDGSRFVDVTARLATAETPEGARQQTQLLAARLAAAYPESDAAWGFEVTGLRDSLFGDYRKALWLIAAAVGLVLLVATVNVAGLQLSRNAGRAQEFAVRLALGVTRGRLVRQLLTESTLLVAVGSLAGVALAAGMLKAVVSLLPEALLRVERPHVDVTVLGLSCAIALVVGLATGIFPALRSAKAELSLSGTRTTVGRRRLLGRGFAAAQIALALVLLTLSAAVLQRLYSLLHTPLGYDAAELQTFSIDLPWGIDPEKSHRLYSQAEAAIAAMPSVAGVGSITSLPLSGFSARRTFDVAGAAPTPHHDAVVAEGRNFSPGYLGAMRIPLLAGRNFTANDAEPNAPPVVLVNKTFAERYFPGQNPVGQRLTALVGVASKDLQTWEIVGVTGDVRGTGGNLATPIAPEIYYAGDAGWPHMQFAVRTTLPASELEPALRRTITGLDGQASLGHYATLAGKVDRSLSQPRLNAELLSSFAVLSLVLVVLGVYGLVAFDVSQRVREMALRIALGSSRNGVLVLVLREALLVLIVGLMAGLGMSWAASRLLAATIFEQPGQSLALTEAAMVVLAVAVLAATLVPAGRASRIDPMAALRSE